MQVSLNQRSDWVSSSRSFVIAWGLPIGAMVVARIGGEFAPAIVWPLALLWMGSACLLNARHCGRTHCYFTGPFFLVSAAVSLLYGLGIINLGPMGWPWLGGSIGFGAAALWFGSEAAWDKFRRK